MPPQLRTRSVYSYFLRDRTLETAWTWFQPEPQAAMLPLRQYGRRISLMGEDLARGKSGSLPGLPCDGGGPFPPGRGFKFL